jgi:CheY-like chemotaxis protein
MHVTHHWRACCLADGVDAAFFNPRSLPTSTATLAVDGGIFSTEEAVMPDSATFHPSVWDYVATTSRRRVILAHGDRQLRHFYATGLRRNDHAVLATSDGEEALAILSSISRGELPKPDAVVLDLHLGIHSGLQLLGALRRAGWRMPVIVMSGKLDGPVRAIFDQLDVFACITKPVATSVLARAVDEAVKDALTEHASAT